MPLASSILSDNSATAHDDGACRGACAARRGGDRHAAGGARFRHRQRPAARASRASTARCRTPCSCARSPPARSRRSRAASASCMRSRKLGVPVWNSAQAIERCVDKSMTTFLLAERRPADAADLRRRGTGRGAGDRRARASGDAAGAEAAVRRAGPRHQAGRATLATCRPTDEVERRLLSPALCAARRPALPRFSRLRLRRQGGGDDEPPRRRLDHQRQPRRRAGTDCPTPTKRELAALAVAAAAAVGADFAGVDIVAGSRRQPAACWRSTACRPGRGCNRSPR